MSLSAMRKPLRMIQRRLARLQRWAAKRRQTRRYVPVYTLWRSWCDEVTFGGKFLIAALILSGIGTVTVQLPIYQIFCGLVAMTLVSLVAGFASLPWVRITAELPSRVVAGEKLLGDVEITSRSRIRRVFDVGVGLFDLPVGVESDDRSGAVESLAPGETQSLQVLLRAQRRGLFDLPPFRVFTTFPFNLFRIGLPARGNRSTLLVLPQFHPLDSVNVPVSMRYQPGGIALTSNIGESPEYVGNREYVPGEPVRRMDFRSWARLGRPIVREYQEEFYCRVGLIVDTFVAPDRQLPAGGFPDLEAAISMTAAIADGLAQGEYLIDIFAAGDDLHVFRAGRHTAHLENILEILACVEPSRKDAFVDISSAIAHELESISTAICVLLAWDKQRQSLVRQIQEAGCALKIILISDEPDSVAIDVDAEIEVITPETVQSGGVLTV